jgi:two-component system sensor histidine kinase ChvG
MNTLGERARRIVARISIRLLAFNVLLVFLPAAGLLYLDTYEKQLLAAQERSMVQQGRLLAAALAEPDGIDPWYAERLLRQLRRRHQARLRVVDVNGYLVADSSQLGPRREPREDGGAARPSLDGANRSWLYRLGALPFRLYRQMTRAPGRGFESSDYYADRERLQGSEMLAAFAGRYGATTRISGGQRSVTLYTAIPIAWQGDVIGVALVSQSTLGILQMLYEVRVDIFIVVLASVAAAAVLSLLVSTTIARPLRRLRAEARAIVDRRGRLQREFRGSARGDEIGDLSRALEDLTRRLRGHVEFIEAFASDVSHEFKNPLASIRSASELLTDASTPEERKHLIDIAHREVARMERLLAAVREITHIDAQLDREGVGPVDVAGLLRGLVAGSVRDSGPEVTIDTSQLGGECLVCGSEDRLGQVFGNLLDNAASFSPPGGRVRVDVRNGGDTVRIGVEDDGPGVSPENRDKIFERFFSFRPGAEDGDGHTGLGLPIARAVVESYGGTIVLDEAHLGGSRFEVRLPLV